MGARDCTRLHQSAARSHGAWNVEASGFTCCLTLKEVPFITLSAASELLNKVQSGIASGNDASDTLQMLVNLREMVDAMRSGVDDMRDDLASKAPLKTDVDRLDKELSDFVQEQLLFGLGEQLSDAVDVATKAAPSLS